ncbi:MAG: LysM peptidoglycan-binding domain-containing protein, partial [Thermodesulfobacteriota bacterium]|nr:LysM peptidoglycan-binding domain-containing protein [Thermodesulfobacteriota bacterium]
LAYLVLIESGFKVRAYSPAHAAGLWQFIPATGRRYGLKINDWVDERLHPEKSTRAAADYLSDLHEMFGSWYLAAAGYNAGEGKILKGLRKYKATNFWEIAEENYLRAETKNYVPKFLAAILLAKEPKRYGLTGIKPVKPEEFDEVVLAFPTDLDVIARLCKTKTATLRNLNPQLKLWCTPLGVRGYVIRVPKGSGTKFLKDYAKLKPKDRLQVSTHKVGWGESLRSIARLYGLSASTLKKFNRLRSYRLKRGQAIKIPVGAEIYLARQKKQKARLAAKRAKLKRINNQLIYTIKPGDSPWLIAKRFDLHWKDIAVWNEIKNPRRLKPGRELVLYLDSDAEPKKTAAESKTGGPAKNKAAAKNYNKYKVQAGDSLWKIAKRFNVRSDHICEWNQLKDNRVWPGQVLKIAVSSASAKSLPSSRPAVKSGKKVKQTATDKTRSPKSTAIKASRTKAVSQSTKVTRYTVKDGDSLWKISKRFKVNVKQIQAWNGLKDVRIRPGRTLKIAAPSVSAKAKTAPLKKHSTYRVQDGDNLWKISRRFNIDPAKIRAWNGMEDNFIRPGDELKLKPVRSALALSQDGKKPASKDSPQKIRAKTMSYTVRSGDTLWKIAQRFKVEPGQIRSW